MSKQQKSEQAVLNRRLKPVYDAVDAGNNKKAIQEAEKLLKKHPTTYTAKALKALALIRMERASEAWPIVEEVDQIVRGGHNDENTLQVVCYCYKEGYVPEKIPLLIEEVVKREKNETLLLELFHGYARVRDHKNQQRVAQMLCKDFNKRQYVMWAISSIVLQAESNPAMGPKVFYPLAQKMLEKLVKESTMKPLRSEILLYVQILEGQQKFSEALDYIKKTIEDKHLNSEEGREVSLNIIKSGELFERLWSTADELLKNEPFDLQIWQTLFETLYKIVETKNEIKEKFIEDLEKKIEVVGGVINDVSYKIHSHHVIKCMFIQCLAKNGIKKDSKNVGSLLSNIKAIINVSVDKPYCFKEIAGFLSLLNENERKELLKFIDETFKVNNDNLSNAYLLRELIRCVFGDFNQISAEKRQEYALNLLHKLSDLDEEQTYYALAISLIISNVLWNVYLDNEKSPKVLEQLIISLEFIFYKFPNNYITALIALRIHVILGNHERISALVKALQVKYIQKDSLAYLNYNLAEEYGKFNEAVQHYTGLSAFADLNDREISSSIINAYKAGSVEQVSSLITFSRNSDNSLFGTGADVHNRLISSTYIIDSLDLIASTLYNGDKLEWDTLVDTRDFNVLNSFELYDKEVSEKVQKITFDENLALIKLRHSLCKAIGSLGQDDISSVEFNENLHVFYEQLIHCKENYEKAESHYFLQGFGTSIIFSLTNGPFLSILRHLLKSSQPLVTSDVLDQKAINALVTSLNEQLDLTKLTEEITKTTEGGKEGTNVVTVVRAAAQALNTLALTEITLKFMGRKFEKILKNGKGDKNAPKPNFKSASDQVYAASETISANLSKLQESIKNEKQVSFETSLVDLAKITEVIEKSSKQSATDSINEMKVAAKRVQLIGTQLKFRQIKL